MGLITTPKASSPYTITLLLIPPALLALTYLIPFPDYCAPPLSSSSSPLQSLPSASAPPPDPEFRLLIGILTLPGRYARRHLLRHVYSLQDSNPSVAAHVDVRFVFCNVTDEADATLVALEAMRYGDVVVLSCDESMNAGKTYAFFASLPDLLGDGSRTSRGRPYDYVMKTDDDTYFRLDRLAASLRGKPTEDFYYGAGLPFPDPQFPSFMLGMGYILSWDLVEWIATSEIPRGNAVGPEDMLTGKWLNTGNKARNRYNTVPYMYDYKGPTSGDFLVNTIAVHQLKENSRWAHTLKYFNVTKGLKPSKFYHFS